MCDGTDLGFYAADGSTRWRSRPPCRRRRRGLLRHPDRPDPHHHDHPLPARGCFGVPRMPLGDLEGALVGLEDLSRFERRTATRTTLAGRLGTTTCGVAGGVPDPPDAPVRGSATSASGTGARLAELDPSMRVTKAHVLTGLSPKRFTALFRSEVGLSPKAYLRVRRLQAALRALNSPRAGATIAADLGYFDQPTSRASSARSRV